MSYSIIGIIAIVIHLIINRDMLWSNANYSFVPAQKEHRQYIFGMLFFCITDVLWGFLNEFKLITPLYIDTVIFFIAMMAGFLLWTRYIVAYLNRRGFFEKVLSVSGIVLFCSELVILAINFVIPIQFWFDENGVYHAGSARNITLLLQILLFLLTSTMICSAPSHAAIIWDAQGPNEKYPCLSMGATWNIITRLGSIEVL